MNSDKYIPVSDATSGYNWVVRDTDDNRTVCTCPTQMDAEMIAEALQFAWDNR